MSRCFAVKTFTLMTVKYDFGYYAQKSIAKDKRQASSKLVSGA